MSKLGTLIRAGLKANFGLAILSHRLFKEKKDRWFILLLGFAILGAIPLLYGLVSLVQEAYDALKPIGQQRALLNLGILSGQLVILIFGIFYVVSAFYFSRDLEMLIPLPLRPFEVMASKFAVILVNEYLTISFFVLPILITYGVKDRSGAGYWASAVLVYLTLPVIPLAIVSVLVVCMMRAINISRKKDFLILVGSIALIVASFGIQYVVSQAEKNDIDAKDIAGFFTEPDSLLNWIGSKFPPSIWATKAIAGGFSAEGLANLAVYLGSSFLLFAVMIVLAERLFYRGVIGLSETSIRKRTLSRDEMSRQIASGRRAIFAIFIREWRIMNRTPIFLLNGILAVVIIPALLILMTQTGREPMDKIAIALLGSGSSLPAILVAALFMIICGCTNSTSSSTFSREGAQFWISRVIPVSPREQATAKFLHSYVITLLGIVAALIAITVLLPLKTAQFIASIGLALLMGVLLTAVGMIIDLARPLLDWTNPQKAVKQNLNVMFALFADIGILAASFYGVRAMIKAEISEPIILAVLFGALAMLAGLSYMALLRFADKRYSEIEA